MLVISLCLSNTSSSSRLILLKPVLLSLCCFRLLLQSTFFLCLLFGCMRDHLGDLGRDFLCIFFKLSEVDLHPGERVGPNFMNKSLQGLCILLKHDDVVSAAFYPSMLFDKGESSIDKVLVGQFDICVGK